MSMSRRRGSFHIFSTQGRFARQGLVSSTGSASVLISGYRISHVCVLKVVPENLSFSSPSTTWFSLISCAYGTVLIALKRVILGPVLNKVKKVQHLRQCGKIYIFFVSRAGSRFRWVDRSPLPKFLSSALLSSTPWPHPSPPREGVHTRH